MAERRPIRLLRPGQLVRVRGRTTLDGESATILRSVSYDPDLGMSEEQRRRGRMYRVLCRGQEIVVFEDELRIVDEQE